MRLEKIARRDATDLTRRHIVTVARRLIADRGLAFTSLQEIADAAGLSRPGLLKHFSSKSGLLAAVAECFIQESAQAAGPTASLREAAARWSAAVSDYRPVSTVLVHEAMTSPPDRRTGLAGHHDQLLNVWAEREHDAAVLARVDGDARASVLTAMWEGLQVMRSFLAEADPTLMWDLSHASQSTEAPPATSMDEAFHLNSAISDDPGYATGRQRRDTIVIDAAALFSRNGYHGTTMREIAERVGVAPSALLYHFPDKAALLAEVLRRRDIQMVHRRAGEVLDPVIELQSIGAEALRDELAEQGLISLYAVLSTEAAIGPHPAREYFRDRFELTVGYFENVVARASADLALSLHPRREAILLVALWDGLQYQYLLSDESSPTDIPATLDAYISGLLAGR